MGVILGGEVSVPSSRRGEWKQRQINGNSLVWEEDLSDIKRAAG